MTIAPRLTEAEEARTSAQRLADAAADQVNAIDALSAFLSREIAESERRLAPCVCGHITMFCACPVEAASREPGA